MKKIILICCLVLLISTGCSRTASEINLKNKNEIMSFCKKNYGKAIYVSESSNDNDDKIFKLKDAKYDFEYSCISEIYEVNFDGTTGLYAERTTCSFENEYKEYILDKVKEETDFGNSIV